MVSDRSDQIISDVIPVSGIEDNIAQQKINQLLSSLLNVFRFRGECYPGGPSFLLKDIHLQRSF